jgi:hypothetical protein
MIVEALEQFKAAVQPSMSSSRAFLVGTRYEEFIAAASVCQILPSCTNAAETNKLGRSHREQV